MGVPAFFRKLSKKYPHIIRNNPEKTVKALYIDANCLFHPQCFKVLDLYKDVKNHKKLFKLMVNRIIQYIDYMIRLTNPTDLVYIAVDGVAPLAKINQQRMRRFGYANNYRHRVYKKHGVKFNDSWSNIVITPGTKFMYDLHNKIRRYYKQKTGSNKDPKCTYKILYSSYLNPGEGEHKILQHIKKHTSQDEEMATVVYGLDADLIFLSMASQCPNMFLLREADQFRHNGNNNSNDDSVEEELCYADIDVAKKSIRNDFNKMYHISIERDKESDMFGDSDDSAYDQSDTDGRDDEKRNVHDKEDFTNDYIFICYFLGNDFLPHLPSIDIKMDGMETIFSVYMDVYQNKGSSLIKIKKGKVSIDNDFLLQFITILATKEEDFFRSVQPEQLRRQRRRRCFDTEPHKREIWRIENLKNVRIVDNIKLGDGEADEWKERYYAYYFRTDEHRQETVNEICHNYFEGLIWVARYYFEKCPTWRWQYKFTHAPFLSDMMLYLKGRDIMKDFDVPYQGPVDMYTQLVSVIPTTYSHILPVSLRHLNCSVESPIIDMFPHVYDLDMINKTQLYKCVPMIPYLDLDRVIQTVEKFELSEAEKIRSNPGSLLNLGICKGQKV